ncbi:hypothetical protein O4160_13900 [Rhodococcus sp. IEGM 1401]|uniref:hypothetical protein n=1 Tax=unclassified Rhodococcus (in: high G+C Gram-positive bacteria) TaxID=192944 RepID=UPI0022B370BA|nr:MULTISPECIES: hypothetical protein [unclassified Rhodococcus (in: high G+C Gram-positive bacteria)]MCZ4561930.1 hypothetical protein [Rhodococcus sp. IEGM 1401]MDI9922704.1 hypothetical protein [Rhodococcus sp. IEGM 1372]MDV8034551.1 hypothetical protein [Rhodococcus sp. IEGM 1414]
MRTSNSGDERLLPDFSAAEVERLLNATRPWSVTSQWERLSRFLTANLKVENFGVSDKAITEAELAMCPLAEEVRELYRCVERVDDRRGMLLLPPSFELLPVSQATDLAVNKRLARRLDLPT